MIDGPWKQKGRLGYFQYLLIITFFYLERIIGRIHKKCYEFAIGTWKQKTMIFQRDLFGRTKNNLKYAWQLLQKHLIKEMIIIIIMLDHNQLILSYSIISSNSCNARSDHALPLVRV